MLANAAQHLVDKQTSNRKLPYQANFAQTISKAKNTIVELMVILTHRLKERLIQLVDYIACTCGPVRNNRSNPRIKRKPNSHAFYMNYKRAK